MTAVRAVALSLDAALREECKTLVRRLSNAAYSSGSADERDSWKQQDKWEAESRRCAEALVSAIDRLAADAARYRWLRDVAWNNGQLIYFEVRYGNDEWDERIDAALAGPTLQAGATAQTASEDQSNV